MNFEELCSFLLTHYQMFLAILVIGVVSSVATLLFFINTPPTPLTNAVHLFHMLLLGVLMLGSVFLLIGIFAISPTDGVQVFLNKTFIAGGTFLANYFAVVLWFFHRGMRQKNRSS